MISRTLTIISLAGAVALAPSGRASADVGSFAAGAAIGGLVGHLATKDAQRKKTYRSSRLPSTTEGRQIQTSLNYFGFDAGRVDGQLGRKSSQAISQYQAYMGMPVTGSLTVFEQDFLINSYNRAVAGGSATMQMAAATPDGTRGLLKVWMAELANPNGANQTTVVTAAPTPYVTAPQTVVTPAPAAPQTTVVAAQPAPAAAPTPAPAALPTFQIGTAERSLTSHCNTVSLTATTNGGFITAANMTDPISVLSEQFCLARTYAIGQSEAKIAQVRNVTPEQVEAQCGSLAKAMSPYVALLATRQRDAVMRDATVFVVNSGMQPDQLMGAGQICLGIGYRKDDMPMALGSALLLVALGQNAYSELVGHHLSQGFGTATDKSLSANWYQAAFDAIDQGESPVFAPGQPERIALLRLATGQVFGTAPQQASQTGLPTFSLGD
ncbi:MAG: peptidoglycan-binding domain-containing protein [Marinibacterium sp.]